MINAVEWKCAACGSEGQGFMPEEHAAGACEPTRERWEDAVTLVRAPYAMVPEVALSTAELVWAMLEEERTFLSCAILGEMGHS